MNHNDTLFQAILNAPDDDAPRLIYADFLEEHGEPERAEFIRVQCTLATLPDGDPRREQLATRERQLLQLQNKQWGGPLSDAVRRSTFSRGLLLELDFAYRRIGTVGANSLAFSPDLAFLNCLQLAGNAIGDTGVEALAGSPYLSRLTYLDLTDNAVTPRGVRALAESCTLRNLMTLYLGENALYDEGVILLAEAPVFKSLTTLGISCTGVDYRGLQAIASSPVLSNVQELDLHQTEIGDDAVAVLRQRFGERVHF